MQAELYYDIYKSLQLVLLVLVVNQNSDHAGSNADLMRVFQLTIRPPICSNLNRRVYLGQVASKAKEV